jgi:myo-inositol-1(or 4)-monophosphatase
VAGADLSARWSELRVALAAADAAARVIAKAPARTVHHKGPSDLVTDVDVAAEDAIRKVLSRHTPDIAVLAEEGGGPWEAATRWVVDPLDGTTNFVHGLPWYAVSIALQVDGRVVAGVVCDPVRGWTAAADASEAWSGTDRRPLQVSSRRLGDALVATGFATDHAARSADHAVRVEAVLRHCRCVRRCGAAALDLALVAAGTFDIYLERSLKPWDVAAGAFLVERAGGRVTDWDGGTLDPRAPNPVASNGALHEAALALLAMPRAW